MALRGGGRGKYGLVRLRRARELEKSVAFLNAGLGARDVGCGTRGAETDPGAGDTWSAGTGTTERERRGGDPCWARRVAAACVPVSQCTRGGGVRSNFVGAGTLTGGGCKRPCARAGVLGPLRRTRTRDGDKEKEKDEDGEARSKTRVGVQSPIALPVATRSPLSCPVRL